MEEKTCRDCKHFRMHYIRYENERYVPIHYGHCVYPRLKKRESETPACQNFKPQEEA